MAVWWQYVDDQGTWRDMLAADSRSLEALHNIDSKIRAELPLGPHGLRYMADLASMCQINLRTGLQRQIRRVLDTSSAKETLSDVSVISDSVLSEVVTRDIRQRASARSDEIQRQIRRVLDTSSAKETPSDVTVISEPVLSEATLPSPAQSQFPLWHIPVSRGTSPAQSQFLSRGGSLQMPPEGGRVRRSTFPASSSQGGSLQIPPAECQVRRSSSLQGSSRSYRDPTSSSTSLRAELTLRAPGPATYDTSRHHQAITPRGAVPFGATPTGRGTRLGRSRSPSPQDYDARGAWERSSSSTSSSSARMRSPRKGVLLRGGRVVHLTKTSPTPGPASYDTCKYNQALSSRDSAIFGRTVRLVGQYCRTPTSEENLNTSSSSLPLLEQFPRAFSTRESKTDRLQLSPSKASADQKLRSDEDDQVTYQNGGSSRDAYWGQEQQRTATSGVEGEPEIPPPHGYPPVSPTPLHKVVSEIQGLRRAFQEAASAQDSISSGSTRPPRDPSNDPGELEWRPPMRNPAEAPWRSWM